ncbi:T9SS type A sorting domain-containing protein, partial [Winogradskyella sp. UBA3174]
SMYIYDNVVYDYVQMANTNATNLFPGTMYHTLIRGDRTTDLSNNTATPSVTTLRATGELTAENEGSKTISVNVPEQRFIAAGNPFQSQVDMNAVLTTNATNISPNFYWVWDPTLGARGAYTAVIASTGTASAGDSDANQYLQAGQAGWVQTAGAGQSSVSFTQASKNTPGPETSVFSTSSELTSQGQLRLSLYESSALANNETATDGLLILFDTEGNNDVDANDAPNITNLDENFATSNNGVLLSIETRATPLDEEEIQLEINTYRNTNYTIVAEGISMQEATAFLYDNFTNIYTEIPQSGTVNYDYSVDSETSGSIDASRFKIVFSANVLSVGTYDMNEVLLYPNPTNIGKFYLNIPLGMDDLEVTIYNVLGVSLYHETGLTGGNRVTINTGTGSRLSLGTYFVKLSSQGKTITKKLIIN